MDSSLTEETETPITPTLKKRKCLIGDVHLKQNAKAEPLLVSFSNGRVLDNADLNGTLYQNISTSKRRIRHRVFVVDTPKMRYAGKNFGLTAGMTSRESVFIGVLDKNTGKMELVETSSFLLHPVLEDIKSTNHHLKDSVHSLTFDEKQEQVVTSFGTKKAKQYVNRRKQYQVNTEDMALAIDQAASAVDLKSEDLEQGVEEKNPLLSILPECDRDALSIEDVYKLEVIAPDYFLCNFEKTARHLLAGNDPDENFQIKETTLHDLDLDFSLHGPKSRLSSLRDFHHHIGCCIQEIYSSNDTIVQLSNDQYLSPSHQPSPLSEMVLAVD
ncbi:DNA-directed RNA polymerase I subunit RPA49-like [Penaeus indicus]|uniref:DNA-directed RNA polymerase I subunit RPA49-like n=1 Tax=Penaeus indicus TaxID=29960 RepID=UPI00300C3335